MSQRPRWWTGRVLSPTVSGGSGTELVALTPLLAGSATPAPLPGRGRGEVCGVVVAFVNDDQAVLGGEVSDVVAAGQSLQRRYVSGAVPLDPPASKLAGFDTEEADPEVVAPGPAGPCSSRGRGRVRRGGTLTRRRSTRSACACPREWRPCPGWRQSSARRCLARCGTRCGDPAAVALDPPGRNGGDLGRAQDFDVSRTEGNCLHIDASSAI